MAQRIGIVVDSTADFPIEVAEDLQIHIVPVHIFIDGKDYLHGDTISNQQVIDSLHHHKEVKTAPPFPAEYSDLYTRIGHRYDTILSFHVSSELSDCYSSAKNSVRILYDDIAQKIEMVDTQNVTIGQGLIVKKAVEIIRKSGGVDELFASLDYYITNAVLYFTVDNLYWLKRSGKANFLSSFIGSLLEIKPIIGLENGQLVPIAKHRGRQTAIDGLVEQGRQAIDLFQGQCEIWIAHADALDEAYYIQEELAYRTGFFKDTIPIVEVGPTISAHTGPGSLCLAMIPK